MQIINDHNNKVVEVKNFVVYSKDDSTSLCPAYSDSTFCLNPLYVGEGGEIHLSRWSCGPTIKKSDGKCLEERIATFNKMAIGLTETTGWAFQQVKELVDEEQARFFLTL